MRNGCTGPVTDRQHVIPFCAGIQVVIVERDVVGVDCVLLVGVRTEPCVSE